MKNMFSNYTKSKLENFEDSYTNNIVNTSLHFSNYNITNKSTFFEKKIEVKLPKVIVRDNFSINISSTQNIELMVDSLEKEKTNIIELLYNNNLNVKRTAEELNKSISYIINLIDDIAYEWNNFLPIHFFNKIWQDMEENEILTIKDLEFENEITQKVIYVLLSSQSFKESYSYDDQLNGFILYNYNNFNYLLKLLKDYLMEKDINYLSFSELEKNIPYKKKNIKLYIIQKLIDTKVLELDSSKYIYTELKYMYEDKISLALSSLKEIQQDILIERFINHLTLEEIGEKFSKTKERIRQIEEASLKKLYTLLPNNLLNEIRSYISKFYVLPLDKIGVKNFDYKNLIIAVVCYKKLKFNYSFSSELNAIVISNEFKYPAIVLKLLKTVKDMNKTLLTKEDLIKYIKNILPDFKVNMLINILLNNNDLSMVNDQYFFHTQYKSKRIMIELIFELEENGFEIMKESLRIKNILDDFFPDVFTDNDTGRNIANYAQTNDNILLWDWGRYIHIKHIKYILDEFDFTNVIEYLNNNLKDTPQIDLNGYFQDNKNRLCDFGITSKFALHSLLKIKFPEEFSYQDSPWVSVEGTMREGLGDTLITLMNENKIYTLDELSNKLQTHPSRIQQLIERQENVIIVDVFQYIKLEYLNFPQILLEEIIEYINSIIGDFTFIYIDLIVDKFRSDLNIINEYSKETVLLDLLKKCTLEKKFNVNNTRIVDSNYSITRTSLNFHYVIENNLFNTLQVVDKNSLFDYFTSRGLSNRNVMMYYLYSKYKTIVRKSEDLFILIAPLGLTKVEIDKLNILILENIEGEHKVSDLIHELSNKLPQISLPWNQYILGDLMDNDLFEFYPNKIEPIYIKIRQ